MIVIVAGQAASAPTAQVVSTKSVTYSTLPNDPLFAVGPGYQGATNSMTHAAAEDAYVVSIPDSTTTADRPLNASSQIAQAENPQSADRAAPAQGDDAPQETPEEKAERFTHPFAFAADRIVVSAPQEKVPVATPLDIVATFAPGKLSSQIYVEQITPDGNEVAQGSGFAKITTEEGATKTIEIVPAQIGLISIEIVALYSDNALAKKRIALDVAPTADGLKEFTLGVPSAYPLYLEGNSPGSLPERHATLLLNPRLTYQGLKYSIVVYDRSAINMTIDQPQSDPIIKIDKLGVVHPLRTGTAVIVGDIGGVQDKVTVTVFTNESERWPLGSPLAPR